MVQQLFLLFFLSLQKAKAKFPGSLIKHPLTSTVPLRVNGVATKPDTTFPLKCSLSVHYKLEARRDHSPAGETVRNRENGHKSTHVLEL